MKSRHRAREIALQILYQYDVNLQGLVEPAPPHYKILGDLSRHYDHFNVPDTLREFVGQLVAGTLTEVKKLDELIEKHTTHWKISRMSSVDRCLLRMSAYEMLLLKQSPASVVIDEAIELAKQFGTQDTPAFINGVLDSIRKAGQE
jgi:N utilization substance protein B